MVLYIDCRLISKTETGISNFILKVVNSIPNNEGILILGIVNEYDERLKVEQIKVPFKAFSLLDVYKFSHWLKKETPDYYLSMFYSSTLFKLKDVKVGIVVHDLMYKFVPNFFGSRLKDFIGIKYFDFIVNKSISTSNIIFSVSETTKMDIAKYFNKTSVVIGEGTTLEIQKKSVECPFNLHTGSFFLYVGNTRPHKGLNYLLKAYEQYKQKGGELKLVICGGKIKSNNDNVISLGYVSSNDLSQLYHHCERLVFPSLYEGFGLPILDALNHNTPISCNDIPAFREFQTNNTTFFNIKDPNSVAECLSTHVSFDENSAEEVLSKYNWGRTYQIISKELGIDK